MSAPEGPKPESLADEPESGARSLAARIARHDRLIGARLREARLARGKTQDWLARVLGESCQSVQRYERGAPITAGRLIAAAEALGLSVAFLMRDGVDLEGYPLTADRTHSASRSALSQEAYRAARRLDEAADPELRRSLLAVIDKLSAQ